MPRIANPIYDSVFKHLMEHQKVAKGLLSCLLGVKIKKLTPCPQEIVDQQAMGLGYEHGSVRIFRIDFSAVILQADGTEKKVLIEVQKASNTNVEERFREYLGGHYAMPAARAKITPIIGVYILGYWLNKAFPVLTRVKRQYLNGFTGSPVVNDKGQALVDPFIENLTHDAVVVQIPAVHRDCVKASPPGDQARELSMFLRIFNQRLCTDDKHVLVLSDEAVANAPTWLKEMLRVLTKVVGDEETQKQMRVEDELSAAWDGFEEELAGVKKKLQGALVQKEEERRLKEEAFQLKEEERRQKEEALRKIEALERLLQEKEEKGSK